MSTVRYNRSYYSKDLPYVSSVKPYFFTTHSRKASVRYSMGSQCEKTHPKRGASQDFTIFKNSGLVTRDIFQKITSRPSSPVAIPNKSFEYIPASKLKIKYVLGSQISHLNFKALNNIVRRKPLAHTNAKEISAISSRNITKYSKLVKSSRKAIKLSKSPELIDSNSIASIEYNILPRYKN